MENTEDDIACKNRVSLNPCKHARYHDESKTSKDFAYFQSRLKNNTSDIVSKTNKHDQIQMIDQPRLETGASTIELQETEQDMESFLLSDDKTLEELLEDLVLDEDVNPELPKWSFHHSFNNIPAQSKRIVAGKKTDSSRPSISSLTLKTNEESVTPRGDPSHEVTGLLENISRSPRPSILNSYEEYNKNDRNYSDQAEMATEVDEVLSQVLEEAATKSIEPTFSHNKPQSPITEGKIKKEETPITRDNIKEDRSAGNPFLPEPPSTKGNSQPQKEGANERDLDIRMAALFSSKSFLSIKTQATPVADPDLVIPGFGARLESLRALREPVSGSDDGRLDLPDVPRNAPGATGWKITRFTDNDMENWCTVCNNDATYICPECDGEAYCSRCWYEMHKGSLAGFDEKSHRPEILERGKKKRILAGA